MALPVCAQSGLLARLLLRTLDSFLCHGVAFLAPLSSILFGGVSLHFVSPLALALLSPLAFLSFTLLGTFPSFFGFYFLFF